MDKLTDLQICKRIAEIEGYTLNTDWGVADKDSVLINVLDDKFTIYNPLTDKALCFDLAFKGKIDLIFNDGGSASAYYSKKHCVTDGDGKRAICLAYIAKHEANNG